MTAPTHKNIHATEHDGSAFRLSRNVSKHHTDFIWTHTFLPRQVFFLGHMLTCYPRFRPRSRKQWRTPKQNLANGFLINSLRQILRSSARRRPRLHAYAWRHSSVRICHPLPLPSPADRLSSDLKPENLLLDDEFRIKVTDFGTGKLIDVPRSFSTCSLISKKPSSFVPAERATKTFVGTAQYVSPELLEANETSKRYAYTCSGLT
jgi:serine/threonine protein kinase